MSTNDEKSIVLNNLGKSVALVISDGVELRKVEIEGDLVILTVACKEKPPPGNKVSLIPRRPQPTGWDSD